MKTIIKYVHIYNANMEHVEYKGSEVVNNEAWHIVSSNTYKYRI